MKQSIIIFTLLVCFKYEVGALSFPKPRVYVVTPATRHLQIDEAKSAPFYYHKWMRRMDTGTNTTTSTTTVAPKVLTPDLIFAEFESDGSMQKSIRKLLDKEKIVTKSTTMSPIYIPEEEDKVTRVVNYGLPVKIDEKNEHTTAKTSKFSMSDHDYYKKAQLPVYQYTSTVSTTTSTTPQPTTTTTQSPVNIGNIWHIIDNEKTNQYSGNWEELSVDETGGEKANSEKSIPEKNKVHYDENKQIEDDHDGLTIDENFALPGFVTNPGNGAENESRAIRTEQDIKFPYINLKPFQMKPKTKYNSIGSNKKKSNMLTTLDQFSDVKNPVRGEVQDIVYNRQPIDRYNPAQPYLPVKSYGSNLSKQSSPIAVPTRATSNLVPPPPPLPKYSGANFPQPVSYDSFPPYAPSAPDYAPAPPAESAPVSPPQAPPPTIQQSIEVPSNSDTSVDADNDSEPPMDLGYRYNAPDNFASMMNTGYEYKPPAPQIPQFAPTLPPPLKQFNGYHYNKPVKMADIAPPTVDEKPEFDGYHYQKPEPMNVINDMPPSYGSPPSFDSHDSHPPSHDSHPPSHDSHPPSHDSHLPSHDSDYPELIFNKPHGDIKGGPIKEDAMDMMPPPLPNSDMKPDSYGPPPDDHGFPSDFPTDFKFHHDFDDHDNDYHFHHEHHTTTTTETPRVNRFSYYYLGKKLYYLPLYFSVYFIVYVAALIIKAVLRHKIVYPNSWRPNTTTATFFSKRSVDEYLSNDNLHDITHRVTRALATAAEKYMNTKTKTV